jgi:RNA polymerase sigma-70 factor (ECF subfamily)
MLMPASSDTDELLDRSAQGDLDARDRLLVRHRSRLRKMVALRLDRRLLPRIDASDVVQDVMVEAAQRLPEYLRERPMPFYPWLRQLAWDRLIDLKRRHVQAQRRSILREEPDVLALPDESAAELAERLILSGSSPSEQMLREEARERVRLALDRLPALYRDVLELRHLEQLSVAETAAVLGVSDGTVKTRHVRALKRLREILDSMKGGAS